MRYEKAKEIRAKTNQIYVLDSNLFSERAQWKEHVEIALNSKEHEGRQYMYLCLFSLEDYETSFTAAVQRVSEAVFGREFHYRDSAYVDLVLSAYVDGYNLDRNGGADVEVKYRRCVKEHKRTD
jgi:hypothetical protein